MATTIRVQGVSLCELAFRLHFRPGHGLLVDEIDPDGTVFPSDSRAGAALNADSDSEQLSTSSNSIAKLSLR